MTVRQKLLEVHGSGKCYICGLPKIKKGGIYCSYPHGMLPHAPVDPNHPEGVWSWKPVARGEGEKK